MTLMGKKMSATAAVSGRFSTEGLAAMAGDDDNIEMAMAKALIEGTGKSGEALRAWDKIVSTPNEIKHAQERVQEQKAPAPVRNVVQADVSRADVKNLNAHIKEASIAVPRKTATSHRAVAVEQFDLFSLLGDDISQYSELPV